MREGDKDGGEKMAQVDCFGMNKREREENFAFGTTDQSNPHRKSLLMRAVQEKKGGRQGESEREEGYGTPFLHRK